jgi:hypothetical protein
MSTYQRPAKRSATSPAPDSLDEHFDNYFIVARNRGDRHDEVTIRREKTDQYLNLASKDFRFGNPERRVEPHDQVYVYAAIQLVWDSTNRRWALPAGWAALVARAGRA